ncbi:hypothetical protein OE88DRAFT_1654309 [Heliocybe sulcata]|uniref:Uncharacterized protein n=1 Tax=Heliocybe sulcata TaxID=5364 RepID=A0A5C3NJZ4_9AGAM|nr:hypothetical protein OE88DRAFT_1654309 [Heliocybe sulcata]
MPKRKQVLRQAIANLGAWIRPRRNRGTKSSDKQDDACAQQEIVKNLRDTPTTELQHPSGMSGHESPLLRLPVELILIVFDTAAVSSRASALAISLVCSWAHKAVANVLSRTYVWTGETLPPNLLVPQASRPQPRHLWMNTRTFGWYDAKLFGSHLPDLDAIAVYGGVLGPLLEGMEMKTKKGSFIHNPRTSLVESTTRIDASSICSRRSLFILSATTPLAWGHWDFLGGVTHLRLQHPRTWAMIPLGNCPNVTHIAIPYPDLASDPGCIRTLEIFLNHARSGTLQKLILTWVAARPPLRLSQAILDEFITARQGDLPTGIIQVSRVENEPSLEEWWMEVNGGWNIWDSAVPLSTQMGRPGIGNDGEDTPLSEVLRLALSA